MMDVEKIRKDFPILERKIYGKSLVYLDNAATSQRPASVLDQLNQINSQSNGNIHRSFHTLGEEATDAYEQARLKVQAFLGAASREEIIYTSGTTASINLLAYSFSEAFLRKGDKIVISSAEHHSNLVPWQMACMRYGAELVVFKVEENGRWDLEKFEKLLDDKVRLVAMNHISNVLGIVNPVKEMIAIAHRHDIPVMIDGAQGIVHSKIDVQEMDCDFYVFSGHKIFAPTGTGILYGKKKYLEAMPPFMGGGDMVGNVTFEKTTYAELPLKFEAGTPHFAGQACLSSALQYAEYLHTMDADIKRQEKQIIDTVFQGVSEIEGARILGEAGLCSEEGYVDRTPVFSITVDGLNPSDMAQILDKMGIAARSGMLCAQPLLNTYGLNSVLRASFLPYNTVQEAEYFIASLKRAVRMLR